MTEYKIWKKQSPFLYDTLVTKALEWPTLSVQWLPDESKHDDYATYDLLLGTHTSQNDQDYVEVAKIDIPGPSFKSETSIDALTNKFNIVQKIDHEGEVNKLRYCPQDPNLIATLAISGQVLVFDRSELPLDDQSRTCKPKYRLKHHSKESWGLSWSPFLKGHLASASEDGTVALWDISGASTVDIKPSKVLTNHTSLVNDVQYSPLLSHLLASCSDDLSIKFWDTRSDLTNPIFDYVDAHAEPINAISFNPFRETVFASASSDNTVRLWDLRRPGQCVYTLAGHSADVSTVAWSPLDSSVLASGSYDRRINIWDLSMVGLEVPNEQEGPSELVFVHGGHTNKISDFAWHPTLPWTMVSTSEDNIIQVWRVSGAIVDKEFAEDDAEN